MKKMKTQKDGSDGATKADITALKSDITSVKSDITGLKSDITALKSDITGIKSDIQILRSDIKEIVTEVVVTHVAQEIEKLAFMVKRGFDDVHERMATKEELQEVRMELKSDIGSLINYVRPQLKDHEVRIHKLERA